MAQSILLSWFSYAYNTTGFKVYQSTNGVDFSLINTIASTGAGVYTHNSTSLTSDQNYWFRVTEYNGTGESTATEIGPLNYTWTPTVTEFSVNSNQTVTNNINVTLINVVENCSEMRFSNDNVIWSDWEAYAVTKDWELPTVLGVRTVYAQFRNGSETTSTSAQITYQTENTISVTWQDNSSDEDGFKIYLSDDNISYLLDGSVSYIANYTLSNINNNQNYYVRVTAYNSAGESTHSQAGPLSCSWASPVISNYILKMRRISRNRKTL